MNYGWFEPTIVIGVDPAYIGGGGAATGVVTIVDGKVVSTDIVWESTVRGFMDYARKAAAFSQDDALEMLPFSGGGSIIERMKERAATVERQSATMAALTLEALQPKHKPFPARALGAEWSIAALVTL